MYKILLVEDDATIAGVIKEQLEQWGYQAFCVTAFDRVLEDFAEQQPQLVLLDLSLPHRSGYYWCQEIRKLSKLPILFLSSAGDNMNMVMAMNLGADDYVAKPFDLQVLVAKIQALLRRTYEFHEVSELLEHRGVILNAADGSVHHGGNTVELTRNEHRILHTLMQQRGRTVSRDELMRRLWESDSYVDDNTLTVNINRLRKKLEEAGITQFIHTKKGEGYRVE